MRGPGVHLGEQLIPGPVAALGFTAFTWAVAVLVLHFLGLTAWWHGVTTLAGRGRVFDLWLLVSAPVIAVLCTWGLRRGPAFAAGVLAYAATSAAVVARWPHLVPARAWLVLLLSLAVGLLATYQVLDDRPGRWTR